MLELIDASNIIVIIIATLAVLLLGDYLGHKIGRWRLAVIVGIIALVSIAAFTVFAVVVTRLA